MKSIHILFAAKRKDAGEEICRVLEKEYTILTPPSFEKVFEPSFLNASAAIVDHAFSGALGFEILKGLKSAMPSMPVIFTTCSGSEEQCVKAFRLGAKEYFSTPFATQELVNSVEMILTYKQKNERHRRVPPLIDGRYSSKMTRFDGKENKVLPNIDKARVFIEENYNRDMQVDMLAAVATLSRSHFSRSFREMTGMTCPEYVNSIRIRESKRLLKTTPFTVSEVCFAVGYNDLTYFERVFKKAEGESPVEYRKKRLSYQ